MPWVTNQSSVCAQPHGRLDAFSASNSPDTMRTAVLAAQAALFLALLGESASKDYCSKEWMRYMIVSACGLDKRDLQLEGDDIMGLGRPSTAVDAIVNEVMEEMDRMHRVDDSNVAAGPVYSQHLNPRAVLSQANPQRDLKDKKSAFQQKGWWAKLMDHPAELLGLTDLWLGLGGNDELLATNPRRRAIQNMISHCCSEECEEEDYRGVC